MKLDELYSSLTIKTGAKLALIVLDGLGDIATAATGNMTPLEAATTPNLVWNAGHDWVSVRFQLHHGLGGATAPGLTGALLFRPPYGALFNRLLAVLRRWA